MFYRLTLLLLIAACASCKKPYRSIEICLIDGSVAHCAEGEKQDKKSFPVDLLGFYAFDEEALNLLAARLEECEQKGKLPRNDDTWTKMQMCIIEQDKCGIKKIKDLQGYFATSKIGARKIADRLEFCTR